MKFLVPARFDDWGGLLHNVPSSSSSARYLRRLWFFDIRSNDTRLWKWRFTEFNSWSNYESLALADRLGLDIVPCLLDYSLHIGIKLSVLAEPPTASYKYHFIQLLQTRNQWLAVFSKVVIHSVKNTLRYLTSLFSCKSFCRKIVPVFILRNGPALDLPFSLRPS